MVRRSYGIVVTTVALLAVLALAVTTVVTVSYLGRERQTTQSKAALVGDGPGGACNQSVNNGCLGDDGCRSWERCDNGVCTDTTNGGSQPPAANSCGGASGGDGQTTSPTPSGGGDICAQTWQCLNETANQETKNLFSTVYGGCSQGKQQWLTESANNQGQSGACTGGGGATPTVGAGTTGGVSGCFHLALDVGTSSKSNGVDFNVTAKFVSDGGDGDIQLQKNGVLVAGWNAWNKNFNNPFVYVPQYTGSPIFVQRGSSTNITYTGLVANSEACPGVSHSVSCSLSVNSAGVPSGNCGGSSIGGTSGVAPTTAPTAAPTTAPGTGGTTSAATPAPTATTPLPTANCLFTNQVSCTLNCGSSGCASCGGGRYRCGTVGITPTASAPTSVAPTPTIGISAITATPTPIRVTSASGPTYAVSTSIPTPTFGSGAVAATPTPAPLSLISARGTVVVRIPFENSKYYSYFSDVKKGVVAATLKQTENCTELWGALCTNYSAKTITVDSQGLLLNFSDIVRYRRDNEGIKPVTYTFVFQFFNDAVVTVAGISFAAPNFDKLSVTLGPPSISPDMSHSISVNLGKYVKLINFNFAKEPGFDYLGNQFIIEDFNNKPYQYGVTGEEIKPIPGFGSVTVTTLASNFGLQFIYNTLDGIIRLPTSLEFKVRYTCKRFEDTSYAALYTTVSMANIPASSEVSDSVVGRALICNR